MNMVEATLARENQHFIARAGSQSIALEGETLEHHPGLRGYDGRQVVLGIRPEDLEDAQLTPDRPAEHRIRGKVELTEALGSEIMVHFSVDARPALTEDVRELAEDVGRDRPVQEGAAGTATLVGRFGARSRVRVGETVEIAVDTRALHFFDPETGLGIYEAGPTTKGAGA